MTERIRELLQLPRRRYEHRAKKTETPEFLDLLRQASAKETNVEDLAALFSQVVIENTSTASKKACTLRLSIARNNGNIFVNHSKKPVVEAYINPITGLLVCQDEVRSDLSFDGTRDHVVFTPHHQFQMLGFAFASKAIQDYIDDLKSLSPNELQALALKPLNQIVMELKQFFEDGNALYKNIAEELTYLDTPSVPQANQFMAFADEDEPRYLVTDRVPYPNPINHLDIDTRLVDRFLNVFFDETNKARFAWYMGAALRNIRIDDPSVSKMLMVSSSHAGSGKSTLVTALTNALFTKAFGNLNGDFDEHFDRDNRFASESLVNTRMNVYLEAEFGKATKDGNNHDFNNLKVSAIKTMITDGYMATEEKYQSRKNQRAFGLHMVLTNHPARITEETDALRRRILPCLIKPTSMEEKARELGLFGQKTFETWVEEHALEFAVYFVRQHMQHEYDYTTYLYNSKAFIREVNHYRNAGNADLDPLALMTRNSDNVFAVLDIAAQHYGVSLEAFVEEVKVTPKGVNYGPMRISSGTLYLDSSAKYLSQFTSQPDTLRDILIEIYGAPEKKYQRNRFTIPLSHTDYDDFVTSQKAIAEHEENESQSEEPMNVVDQFGRDVELSEIPEQIKQALEEKAQKTKERHIKERVEKPEKREPAWMKHVDKSTLFDYKKPQTLTEGPLVLNESGMISFVPDLSIDKTSQTPQTSNATEKTIDTMTREELMNVVASYEQEMLKVREWLSQKMSDQ